MLARLTDNYVSEQLHTAVTGDVTVSEDEVKAKYDSMVAADQNSYADDYSYNSARSKGTAITWNPEGYRAVKHVLLKFSDDQATRYNALKNSIDSLNAELEALEQVPEEAVEEAVEEAEAAEEAEVETETEAAETEAAETEAETAETEAVEEEVAETETRTREDDHAEIER